MKSYRIFVEKYPEFRVEAESLLRDLNANLNLSLDGLRLLNVYDLFGSPWSICPDSSTSERLRPWTACG